MDESQTIIAYGLCTILVAVHAWERFNTPRSNRSSTRRGLFWSSCAGYVLCVLLLFSMLSALLQVSQWRTALLGRVDNASLPAPLIATLALTTLLTSVPLLKRLDNWILAAFHEWGEIPAEIKRRIAAMTPERFTVTADDVVVLHGTYSDASYDGAVAAHLRATGAEGLDQDRYHFTRVVKLYSRLQELVTRDEYGTFFAEYADDFAALDRRTTEFLLRSASSLTVAARLHATESPTSLQELMQERHAAFAQSCRDMFQALAVFIARAVLRSEATEEDIVARLRKVGFRATQRMSLPRFPIDSLTLLAVSVFAYLFLTSVFFSHLPGAPTQTRPWLAMTTKIAVVRVVTVGFTIWLMQRFAFFRRDPDCPPKFFAYVICGLIASLVGAVICLPFDIGDASFALGLHQDMPLIVLSAWLCLVLAGCCDDWTADTPAPIRLRLIEAMVCGTAMVLATTGIYLADVLPFPLTGWWIAAWISLPSLMAGGIGGFVPHIYRSANRAAAARRNLQPSEALSPADVPTGVLKITADVVRDGTADRKPPAANSLLELAAGGVE
jgi:hypothetical protein